MILLWRRIKQTEEKENTVSGWMVGTKSHKAMILSPYNKDMVSSLRPGHLIESKKRFTYWYNYDAWGNRGSSKVTLVLGTSQKHFSKLNSFCWSSRHPRRMTMKKRMTLNQLSLNSSTQEYDFGATQYPQPWRMIFLISFIQSET